MRYQFVFKATDGTIGYAKYYEPRFTPRQGDIIYDNGMLYSVEFILDSPENKLFSPTISCIPCTLWSRSLAQAVLCALQIALDDRPIIYRDWESLHEALGELSGRGLGD